jgi:hypothetical protein
MMSMAHPGEEVGHIVAGTVEMAIQGRRALTCMQAMASSSHPATLTTSVPVRTHPARRSSAAGVTQHPYPEERRGDHVGTVSPLATSASFWSPSSPVVTLASAGLALTRRARDRARHRVRAGRQPQQPAADVRPGPGDHVGGRRLEHRRGERQRHLPGRHHPAAGRPGLAWHRISEPCTAESRDRRGLHAETQLTGRTRPSAARSQPAQKFPQRTVRRSRRSEAE